MTAILLAARGARVVLRARRSDRLVELTRRITGAGGEAICLPIDVSRRDDLTALVAAAQDSYDRLDVLVNNAGP